MKYSNQDFERLRNGMEMVTQSNRKDPLHPWKYRTFSTVCACTREHMKAISDILDNMDESERSDLYGTFYIKKGSKPEIRTFSKKIAKSWGKTSEGKVRFREIQFLKNERLKEEIAELANRMDLNFTEFFNHIHGFSSGKGVLTNVLEHTNNGRKPKHVLNMDLENAFHQISDRNLKDFAEIVMGWNKKTAYNFANILTYNKKMVQGNPLSPVMLNIFALLMDFRILGFCQKFNNLDLKYTRYADDLSISSTQWIPKNLINFISNTIIADSGWTVNTSKSQKFKTHLEITGVQYFWERDRIKTMNRRKHKHAIRALERLLRRGILYLGDYPPDTPETEMKTTESVIRGIRAWLHPDLNQIESKYNLRKAILFGDVRFKSKRHLSNYMKSYTKKNVSRATEQLNMFQSLD